MGREERDNRASLGALQERMLGPILDNGQHDSGCVKCGCPQLAKSYCIGKTAETEKLAREKMCFYEGEHLHGQCRACGYAWVEHCKDYSGVVQP